MSIFFHPWSSILVLQGKASAAAQKRDPAKGRAGKTSMRNPRAARMGHPKRIRARQYRQEGSADRMEKTMVSEQTSRTSWPESIAARGEPSKASIKLYNKLKKAESSALFQARTGRIGLRRFLASARVPGIDSGDCLCRKGRETAEHMLLHCDNRPRTNWSRGAQFQKLVSEPESGALVARQLIQSGRLGQFSLASRLLYSQ